MAYKSLLDARHRQLIKFRIITRPPGVLVARRDLFVNRVPVVPGGGTVSFVNPTEHRYIADIEHREEGGTPAIIESIRAGRGAHPSDGAPLDESSGAQSARPTQTGIAALRRRTSSFG